MAARVLRIGYEIRMLLAVRGALRQDCHEFNRIQTRPMPIPSFIPRLRRSGIHPIIPLLLLFGATVAAAVEPPFTFESVLARDDMTALIRTRFPLGSARAALQHAFVEEGGATLKTKPGQAGTEKYIYDIDLCHYYIWRWNISADYDASGRLRQAYVNGMIVRSDGTPQASFSPAKDAAKKTTVHRVQRLRPEAYKGESSLGYLLLDSDGDLKTTDDQMLIGAGPSRPDPANMGKLFAYSNVDPWRSIFDADAASRISPYQGRCETADKLLEAQKPAQ